MANVPVAGEAFTFTLSLLSQANGQVLLNPTITSPDVLISTDGGTLSTLTTLPAVTPANSGVVEVNLTAAEVGNDHFSVIFSDFSGAEWKTTYYHEVVGDAAPSAPTVGQIADAVWDEAQSGHTTAGTFGYYLDSQVSQAGGGAGGNSFAPLTINIETKEHKVELE